MSSIVSVLRGEVVGIGKVKMPKTREFNHEIQFLSFLVIKTDKNSYVSTCIHLHIDGYGESVKDSNNDMFENIYYFLRRNFESLAIEDAWENLEDLFMSDEWSSELWDAYHKVQIQLSRRGISTDITKNLLKRLKQLETRVKKLESREARYLEEEIMKFSNHLIDYIPIEDKVA